jgi:putative acetyltransferase
VVVRRTDVTSPVARFLITALDAEVRALYPEEDANHFRLDEEEVAPGRGAFLVADDDHEPVGCGAVRLIEPDTAEIKRMYVVPAARGRRIGAALLTALEVEARTLGATRLVLETGDRLAAAVALYRRAGFTPIARFGEYVHTEHSLCMEKPLR